MVETMIKSYIVVNYIRFSNVNQYSFAKLTRVLFNLDVACIYHLYTMEGHKLSIEL
jgi:hypothetical protein